MSPSKGPELASSSESRNFLPSHSADLEDLFARLEHADDPVAQRDAFDRLLDALASRATSGSAKTP